MSELLHIINADIAFEVDCVMVRMLHLMAEGRSDLRHLLPALRKPQSGAQGAAESLRRRRRKLSGESMGRRTGREVGGV